MLPIVEFFEAVINSAYLVNVPCDHSSQRMGAGAIFLEAPSPGMEAHSSPDHTSDPHRLLYGDPIFPCVIYLAFLVEAQAR